MENGECKKRDSLVLTSPWTITFSTNESVSLSRDVN
jgi:hypothetical protein